jgi:hypothetical protein
MRCLLFIRMKCGVFFVSVCDLLYHIKYQFTGDSVKADAERVVMQLRPALQLRLRYRYLRNYFQCFGSGSAFFSVESIPLFETMKFLKIVKTSLYLMKTYQKTLWEKFSKAWIWILNWIRISFIEKARSVSTYDNADPEH